MKKVKRIIAGMAASVMAFSTMSIGASADTYYSGPRQWDLSFSIYPGMPSNIPTADYLTTDYLMFTSTYNKFHSICSHYSSGVDNQGKQAYAQYFCISYKSDKSVKDYTIDYYHYGESPDKNTGTTASFVNNTNIVYGNYVKAFYSLEQDNHAQIPASINGTFYFAYE